MVPPHGSKVSALLVKHIPSATLTLTETAALSGLVEHSNQSKWISKGAIAFMVIGGLIQAIASFGNVNGLANFGSSRLSDASAAGEGGFWTAMIIIESLMWFVSVAGYCFGGYRLFTA